MKKENAPDVLVSEQPAMAIGSASRIAAKTELQAFCEEVVAAHLGLDLAKVQRILTGPPPDSDDESSYSSVDVVALVELIAQVVVAILESCPDQSPERLSAAVAKPTFWQRVRVKHILKNHFDCAAAERWRNESGTVAECLIRCAGWAEAARVQRVVKEVGSHDNWLV